MHRNAFNDGFAESADEVSELIAEAGQGFDTVYCPIIEPDGEGGWLGTICTSDTGDLVCYVESSIEGGIEEILEGLEIDY